MKLPVAPGCGGCSRRELLFGVAAAATLVACTREEPGVDALGGGPDGSPIDNGVTMCGSSVCIDLNNPATAPLAQVNGQLIVIAPSAAKKLILVRTSDTQVVALSDICTHAGCAVHYNPSQMILACPCHGSQFALSGSVIRGPAVAPLKTFPVSIDTTTNTLTVTLA
jgi:nitrite reductase/ring-hydroxylating ferredoxin subunit